MLKLGFFLLGCFVAIYLSIVFTRSAMQGVVKDEREFTEDPFTYKSTGKPGVHRYQEGDYMFETKLMKNCMIFVTVTAPLTYWLIICGLKIVFMGNFDKIIKFL